MEIRNEHSISTSYDGGIGIYGSSRAGDGGGGGTGHGAYGRGGDGGSGGSGGQIHIYNNAQGQLYQGIATYGTAAHAIFGQSLGGHGGAGG